MKCPKQTQIVDVFQLKKLSSTIKFYHSKPVQPITNVEEKSENKVNDLNKD